MIDDCQVGLELLKGLLSHVDPQMTLGQLLRRVVAGGGRASRPVAAAARAAASAAGRGRCRRNFGAEGDRRRRGFGGSADRVRGRRPDFAGPTDRTTGRRHDFGAESAGGFTAPRRRQRPGMALRRRRSTRTSSTVARPEPLLRRRRTPAGRRRGLRCGRHDHVFPYADLPGALECAAGGRGTAAGGA